MPLREQIAHLIEPYYWLDDIIQNELIRGLSKHRAKMLVNLRRDGSLRTADRLIEAFNIQEK